MSSRKPRDDKRRAIEGILGSSNEPPDLPDSYQATGLGSTFESPSKPGGAGKTLIVGGVIAVICLFAAFLIFARDQVLSLIGVTAEPGISSSESGRPGSKRGESEPLQAVGAGDQVALSNLKRANETLERRLQEESEENERLRGDLAGMKQILDGLQAESGDNAADAALVTELRERISKLESDLENSKSRAQKLESDNSTLKTQMEKQIQANKLQLDQLESDNSQLRGQVRSLRSDLGASQSELQVLRTNQSRGNSSPEQLEQVNAEYRRVLNLLSDVRAANRSKDKQIEELLEENGVLRQRIASLSAGQRSVADQREVDSGEVVEQGDVGVTNPVPVQQVRPDYPRSAWMRKVSGVVRIRVLVSELGYVLQAEVVSSPDPLGSLDRAALEAVRQWRFNPARRDGNAVRSWYIIPMEFKL